MGNISIYPGHNKVCVPSPMAKFEWKALKDCIHCPKQTQIEFPSYIRVEYSSLSTNNNNKGKQEKCEGYRTNVSDQQAVSPGPVVA